MPWISPPIRMVFLVCAATAALLASVGWGQALETAPIMTRDAVAGTPGFGTLRSVAGDTYRGSVAVASQPDRVAWNSPSFLKPLEVPWSAVDRLEFPSARSVATLPENTFCVEFYSGHALSGQLLGLDGKQLRIDVPGLGVRTIPIANVRHLLRINAEPQGSLQVLQADAWQQVLPAPKNLKATKWFLKAGEISTDTSGTTISQWGNLPELATIDIDVSWEQESVNWWLTIGEPRRMELQVRKLQNKSLLNVTLLVENSADADVASVQLPYPEERFLSLRVLCDANKGSYVLMHNEQPVGRIKGNPNERIIGRTKFSFTNTAIGFLTLRKMHISSRPFALPSDPGDGLPSMAEILTRERGTFFGNVQGTTTTSQEFLVQGRNDALTRVDFQELERIEFPAPSELPNAIRTSLPLYRLELANGLRFASDRVASGTLAPSPETLTEPQIALGWNQDVIPLMFRDIVQLVALHPTTPRANDIAAHTDSKVFRLLTEDTVSSGMVEAVITTHGDQRTLTWLARGAAAPVPINPTTDGTIEPILTTAPTPRKTAPTRPMATVRADAIAAETEVSRALKPEDPSLFLVSGDCFPATVLSGDQESVRFQSSMFQVNQIPSQSVRGIRIVEFNGTDAIDRQTKSRLLTLPRMQRKNPPTHVVIARDGDVVRGQLLSFDRDELLLEVRGEERKFLVKNLAEIIWLESAPLSEDVIQLPSPEKTDDPGLYQVVLDQGSRLCIAPEQVDQTSLAGSHPLLGPCSLPWSNISRIVLGNAIRVDSARNRYGRWKLENAIDPKYIDQDGSEPNDAPVDTAHDRLMGRAAPDFDLPKLDGTPCQLADYRGKVLIIDFWASWCGPCIQGMPRLLDLSRAYHDLGVELVLINVEESEERVRSFLEKLEIMPTVALDADGSVAKQYAARAIPQTVVIDRDGAIAKILVGASEQNETDLKQLLDQLTGRAPPR
jgi:thiol-disulfide isomerase/thioredoxin